MRYLNWDVLLFPKSSKIPIQEFDTKCHVRRCQGHFPIVDHPALISDSCHGNFEELWECPVVTSFIPSLENGRQFRLSVHSWESPQPSEVLRTFKTPDELVQYEVRVYIDNVMIARQIFDDQTIWPKVLEHSGDGALDSAKPIYFPIFHPESLEPKYWRSGQNSSRIEVTVAEGVTRRTTMPKLHAGFDKLRDIVTFSFKHAPRHLLECSGIAWPGAELLRTSDQPTYRSLPMSDREIRAQYAQYIQTNRRTNDCDETISALANAERSRMKQPMELEDPFLGPLPISARARQFRIRHTSNHSSGRFASIRTARSQAGTEMSGVSYEKADFLRTINQAAIQEIVEALSPEKRIDLFQALSPVQPCPRVDDACIGTNMPGDVSNSAATTTKAALPRPLDTTMQSQSSGMTKHKSPFRGNLLCSKYAFPSKPEADGMLRDDHYFQNRIRTDMTPGQWPQWRGSLSSPSKKDQKLEYFPYDMRTWSTSNAFKRSGLDLLVDDMSKELIQTPNMNRSTSKHCAMIPTPSLIAGSAL